MKRDSQRGSEVEQRLWGALWIILYLALVALPLRVLMLAPISKGGGFWWDFSMGLGFSGLAMLGVQFVLTARFHRLSFPFGTDIIYYFHRWAAISAVTLVTGHYLLLRLFYKESLGTTNFLNASAHMTAGRVSLLIFLLMIITSLFRKQFRIEYDRWRILHGAFSASAVLLAIWHVRGVGYYTSIPAKKLLWTIYSGLWIMALIYVRFLRPWMLLRNPYQVAEVLEERGDSWTVTLQPIHSSPGKFAPGQFAWVTLGSSPFWAKEHPFSFSGSAEDRQSFHFTIKELGDFTRTVKKFKPGDVAYVDGPHGVFTTDRWPNAPGFVFIAGGVGIAPIMSMLRTMADRLEKRPLLLIYGNAKWDRVIFREGFEQLKRQLNLNVVHVLQNPPPDWTGEMGMITREVVNRNIAAELAMRTFFLCGPAPMIKSVQNSLKSLGVPMRRIQTEHFEMA